MPVAIADDMRAWSQNLPSKMLSSLFGVPHRKQRMRLPLWS